jgi:hypothetical protein
VTAFRQGLSETGYVEGHNVAIEYRWADGQGDRLPLLAAELVQRQVAVIAATGGDPTVLAVKRATTTIPTVFTIGGDPVALGLVTSLNRPAGNVTGITQIAVLLDPKRLEVLRELMPGVAVVAVLRNPNNSNAETQVSALEGAARTIGMELRCVTANSEGEIDTVFAALAELHVGALITNLIARSTLLVACSSTISSRTSPSLAERLIWLIPPVRTPRAHRLRTHRDTPCPRREAAGVALARPSAFTARRARVNALSEYYPGLEKTQLCAVFHHRSSCIRVAGAAEVQYNRFRLPGS